MRHEQAALHAADGYARATGKLGVAITSTGPGACNAVPGLFEAQFASSPVLMLTGQIALLDPVCVERRFAVVANGEVLQLPLVSCCHGHFPDAGLAVAPG